MKGIEEKMWDEERSSNPFTDLSDQIDNLFDRLMFVIRLKVVKGNPNALYLQNTLRCHVIPNVSDTLTHCDRTYKVVKRHFEYIPEYTWDKKPAEVVLDVEEVI